MYKHVRAMHSHSVYSARCQCDAIAKQHNSSKGKIRNTIQPMRFVCVCVCRFMAVEIQFDGIYSERKTFLQPRSRHTHIHGAYITNATCVDVEKCDR